MREVGRQNVADPDESTCLAGKFIVSRTGKAYDALA
jgi:hypothetical protein